MSKASLKLQADAVGKSVDELIVDTVRASSTMDAAAKTLRVSRYTIVKRLEAIGLRADSVLLLTRIEQ